MRPKTLVLFALALGCGSIAAVGINQMLSNRNQPVIHVTGQTEPILVALKELNMGELLTPTVVKLEPWPKDKLPPGALTKLADIEGRRTKSKLFAGEPLLEQKLLNKDAEMAGAAQFIPKGYRVVAIKVDDVSAASSLIKPGDRVDVLVHLRANPGSGINETQTVTILQDVKVFSVNEIFHRSHDGAEEAITARTVSLMVTPAQAEVVTLATEMGTIRLVLRSMEDDSIAETSGATHLALLGRSGESHRDKEDGNHHDKQAGNPLLDLLNSQKSPEPTKTETPPADIWRMIVIEADKAQQVEFGDPALLPISVLPLTKPDVAPSAGPLPTEVPGATPTSPQNDEPLPIPPAAPPENN